MRLPLALQYRFRMQVTGDDPVMVTFEGFITEDARLDAAQLPAGKRIVIDTGRVRGMNSLGVRDWVRFLDALCRRSPEVVIRRMPPILVAQTSAIRNFLGAARPESFMLPWECPRCALVVDKEHPVGSPLPTSIDCVKCGEQMKLDDILEPYLAFQQSKSPARQTG